MYCGCAVNSVLAIGGVGGLAVGLAGREILENLFTGLIILSSSPFEVGDEVLFSPPSGQVGDTAAFLSACSFLHAVDKPRTWHPSNDVPSWHGEGALTCVKLTCSNAACTECTRC